MRRRPDRRRATDRRGGDRGQNDDGRILLVGLGFGIVLLALIVTLVAAVAVHLDRKELQATADLAALWAASALDEDSYYTGAAEDSPVPLADESVVASAAEYLATAGPFGLSDVHVAAGTGTADGRQATVVLNGRSHPPVVGWIADLAAGGIPVQVSATARAGLR